MEEERDQGEERGEDGAEGQDGVLNEEVAAWEAAAPEEGRGKGDGATDRRSEETALARGTGA